jgi:hypothetical protein
MTDGRMAILEAGVRWHFNPAQPRQSGRWSGPTPTPGQLQAEAHAAFERLHGPGAELAAVRLSPEQQAKLEGIVREHLAKDPKATTAQVKQRMRAQGYKVEGEPGGFHYKQILKVVNRVKAEGKAPEAPKMPEPVPHIEPPKVPEPVTPPKVPEPKGGFNGTGHVGFGGTEALGKQAASSGEAAKWFKPGDKVYAFTFGGNKLVEGTVDHTDIHGDQGTVDIRTPEDTYSFNATRVAHKDVIDSLGPDVLKQHAEHSGFAGVKAAFNMAATGAHKLPPTPVPTEPADLHEAEAAYQEARKQGWSEYNATQVEALAKTAGEFGRASGIRRYINERKAQHDVVVAARKNALINPKQGWKDLTPDQVRAYYVGALRNFQSATEDKRTEALAARSRISLYRDGSSIIYKIPVKGEHRDLLRAQVEKARRMYPYKQALTVTVGSPPMGRRFGRGVLGQTFTGSGRMFLAPRTFTPEGEQVVAKSVASGHFMPAYKGHSAVETVFVHELGHTVDSGSGLGSNTTTPPITKEALKDYANMSKYGREKGAEAYAEAFTEWHLSDGTTTNPLVRRLAQSEKWATDTGGTGVTSIAHARALWLRDLAAVTLLRSQTSHARAVTTSPVRKVLRTKSPGRLSATSDFSKALTGS